MGPVRQAASLALTALMIQFAVAMYTEEDAVVMVTSDNYDNHAIHSAGPAMVCWRDASSSSGYLVTTLTQPSWLDCRWNFTVQDVVTARHSRLSIRRLPGTCRCGSCNS
jgi:hypothetical protein